MSHPRRVTVIALAATIGLTIAATLSLGGIIWLSRDGGRPPDTLGLLATLSVQQLLAVVTAYIRSEGANGSVPVSVTK